MIKYRIVEYDDGSAAIIKLDQKQKWRYHLILDKNGAEANWDHNKTEFFVDWFHKTRDLTSDEIFIYSL